MDCVRRSHRRHVLLATLTLAALISFPRAWAAVNTWTSLGPDGGQVSTIVFHNSSPSVVYALALSGFYRSTDGGAHWQQNRDGLAPSATALAVDPTNSDRVYLAISVAGKGLFVSNDAGLTFSTLHSFESPSTAAAPYAVAVSANGSTLYALVGPTAVFRSADKGQTWQRQTDLPAPSAGVGGIHKRFLVDPSDDRTVYVVRWGSVVVTHDAGGSWVDITPPGGREIDDFAVDPTDNNRLWVGGAAGLNFSANRGSSWTIAYGGWTRAIALDPKSPSTVYAGDFGGGITKSLNGTLWSAIGDPGSLYPYVMAVSPHDSSTLLVGNLRGLSVTKNGGTSWARSDVGLVASAVNMLAPSSARGRVYASGEFIGTLADGSDSVSLLDEDAFYRTFGGRGSPFLLTPTSDGPGGLLAAGPNRIGRSTDDGITWSPTTYSPDTSEWLVALAATSTLPSVYYASSDRTLRRSTDQGAHWSPITNGLPSGYSAGVIAIAPSNASILYAGPRPPPTTDPNGPKGAGVYKTANGGDLWVPANGGIEGDHVEELAVHPLNPDIVYAYTFHGFMKTVDGGATWKQLSWTPDTSDSNVTGIAIDPQNPEVVYAVGGGRTAHVARSLNGGATWQSLVTPSMGPTWIPTSVVIDPARPNTVRVGTRNHGIQQLTFQLTDLAIELAVTPGAIWTGDVASYSFTLRNVGAMRASGVTMVMQLPYQSTGVTATVSSGSCSVGASAVTCTVPSLEGGASATIAASLTPLQVPGSFKITSEVYADEPDADSSNNAVSRETVLNAKVNSPPASSGSSGGGGGGAMSPLFLLGLATFLFWRRSRHRPCLN